MRARGKVVAGFQALVMAAALPVIFAGCAGVFKTGPGAGTYEGPPGQIGEGQARTFVTMDGSGSPIAIGIRLSETALKGLPAEHPQDADGYEYSLALPAQAAIAGYDHVGIDWNPMGHIPPGVYSVPHFDFHFYLISREQREKITAVGDDLATAHRVPAPEFLPAGYILPPGTEVARMGAHAIDPAAPEFNKQPFAKTFIYGFYDGQMIFLEPMVAKSFLDAKAEVSEAVKVPKAYSRRGYYPGSYSVKFDQGRREYVISLEGLTLR